MKQAVFLSLRGDFHAQVVGAILRRRFNRGLKLSIVDMDVRSAQGGFTWTISTTGGPGHTLVRDNDDNWVDLDESDLVWCRRFTRAQRHDDGHEFLTKQWNSASWSLAHSVTTKWIDRPRDIVDAELKPRQLQYAQEVGLRVPNTLVSQDPDRIQSFFRSEAGGVVVKPLKASIRKQIFTVDLAEEAFERPDDFRAFPAIYQQRIHGDHHLRIVFLPDRPFFFRLESGELDWRKYTDLKIEQVDVDSVVAKQCGLLLRKLNLTMGIIDAKVVDGETWFLEVNPQGQFLFLEALTGSNLRDAYADYFQQALG